MTFVWPLFLVTTLAVPALVGLYVWAQKRRRRGLRYSHITLFRDVLPKRSRRQHVPFGLFAVALAVLAIGTARPTVKLALPIGTSAMILAFDTSGSMCGDRMDAAKQGAAQFAIRHAAERLVGIVEFNGAAGIVALPTNDQKALLGTIGRLAGHGGTRMDLGILRSIDAIAEVNPRIAPTDVRLDGKPEEYAADVIVLLSDGRSDYDPRDEAEVAAERGIRIYTIAYTMPTGQGCSPSFNASPDVVTMQALADATGGEFREAATAAELDAVFDGLPTYTWITHEWVEVSVAFAAVGAALAAAAVLLARLWAPLP